MALDKTLPIKQITYNGEEIPLVGSDEPADFKPFVTTSVRAFVPNIPKAHVNVTIDIENLISTSVTGEVTK